MSPPTVEPAGPQAPPAPAPIRARLFTRDFVLLLAASFTGFASVIPLMSVAPLWASEGGAGSAGVGAVTGTMMAVTVATQLAMGPLLRVLTLRRMLALGAFILAVATPLHALSDAIGPVLVVSAVRGGGFALLVVACNALVVELVSPMRIGVGSGAVGLAAGLSNVLALPVGVWVAQNVGFVPVFLAAGLLALAAVPLTLAITPTAPATQEDGSDSAAGRTTLRPLATPAVVFFAASAAYGASMTFLPLATPEAAAGPLALLTLGLGTIVGRVGGGSVGDRIGSKRLLLPAAVLAVLGVAGAAVGVAVEATAVVVAMVGVFGVAFGVVQNSSLVVIFERAGPGRHGLGSTVWNIAFDAGTGAGAMVLGGVVLAGGYPWAFAVVAAMIAATVPLAWGVGRRARTN